MPGSGRARFDEHTTPGGRTRLMMIGYRYHGNVPPILDINEVLTLTKSCLGEFIECSLLSVELCDLWFSLSSALAYGARIQAQP